MRDAMVATTPTFESLQQLVHERLCMRDRLDVHAAPLQSAKLKRAGRICGMWFQVEGPRLMKNYAIWVGDENRVLFYDSTGERYDEVRLSDSPDLILTAA